MGDIANVNDLDRFTRSPEGEAYLEEIRQMLKGHTITSVSFSSEISAIATTLHLDDGEDFILYQPSLEVESIREQFDEVLEREYYVDYPIRKPEEAQPSGISRRLGNRFDRRIREGCG
mgnify:CR=1 FL=1